VSDRIEAFAVTIPNGTAEASPVTTDCSFRDGIVVQVDVRVPPGPSALMGFRVEYAGVSIIPDTVGMWLLMDNEQWPFTIDNNPTGGQWQVSGYNTDIYDHTIYLRFHVNEFPEPAQPGTVIQPIPLGG
jgi:hypothetical protein